jgi:hypothetical protein
MNIPPLPNGEYDLIFYVPNVGEVLVYVDFHREILSYDEVEVSARITAAFSDDGPVTLTSDQQYELEEEAAEIIDRREEEKHRRENQ